MVQGRDDDLRDQSNGEDPSAGSSFSLALALEKARDEIERLRARAERAEGFIEARRELMDEVLPNFSAARLVEERYQRRRFEILYGETLRNYRVVLEHVWESVVTVDPEGAILSCNPAAERLLGAPDYELVGQNILDLMDWPAPFPDDGELGARSICGMNGEPTDAYVTVVPTVSGGLPTRTLLFRDLSTERRLEEEVLQAQKLAALANVASGAVHDLNNLLMAISGSVAVAGRSISDDSPAVDRLDDIRDAIETGATIARQLLGLVRQTEQDSERVELDVLVRREQALLAALAGDEVELDFELGAPGAFVEARAADLEQVLMNLVSNARDAIDERGRVTVATNTRTDEVAEFAILTVSDEGKGLPRSLCDTVFEPFYTTKSERGGTGLGLYIVRDIVSRAGGDIVLQSEEGRGTTVEVRLPIPPHDQWSERHSTGVYKRAFFDPVGTILLVDAHRLAREAVQHLLETDGHQVLTAACEIEGEGLLLDRGDDIAVVLCDAELMDTDGRPWGEWAREAVPGLQVIYTTAVGTDALVDAGLDPQAVRYIQKPFTQEELRRKIRRCLHERAASRGETLP